MFGEMMRPRHDLAGLRVPIRGLGFTPTGAQLPSECSQYGVRMVEEQGGYTPIGCPVAGKTDCYDIIDAVTGEVIIAKANGKMTWIPQCGQWGYPNQGATGNCPDGQGLINGQCGKAAIPCPNGDGTVTLLEVTQDSQNNVTGLTGRSFGVVTEEEALLNSRVLSKYSFDAATWCDPQDDAEPSPAEGQPQGGCIEPAPDGSGGCRDVVPCPKGPAVSNNPDGAAGPGQGRRYTLVDYKTGELIKDDVGDEIWNQYSVSSLPDAWVCEDPRCKPYCGQDAAAPEPDVQEAAPEPEPESTPSPEPSAPTTPAPIPTTPVTQLSPPQAGFQTPCNPGRPTQMGRARMSRDFFGRSMF
jgi:hypothetical protein